MIYGRFPAMGTHVDVWARDRGCWEATQEGFAAVEAALSRFRDDSELSRLNRDSRSRVPVSELLGSVLEAASLVFRATDGLVDISVGGPVAAWGYDRTFPEVADLDERPRPDDHRSWRYLPEERLVERRPGVALDFGGIGKGWCADRAVAAGLAAVVSAGGDVRSCDSDTVVAVEDGRGGIAARVAVGVGALATSSTLRRTWRVAGERVSHLIDPRTSAPVRSPVVSATAVAATALEAEAAAKAVLILGEAGLAWAAARPWVRAALVVWEDGSIYSTTGLEVAA